MTMTTATPTRAVGPAWPAHVLRPMTRHHPYQLAPLVRDPVITATAKRLRIRVGTETTLVDPERVTAIADEAAWEAVQAAHRAFADALAALAGALRQAGTYATRLQEVGG